MSSFLKRVENDLLKSYTDSDFVTRQKTRLLVWFHISMIPVIISLIIINMLRNSPKELNGIITLDYLFLASLITGIYLIKKGKGVFTANLDILFTMLLTTAGCLMKFNTHISTGFNSFYLLTLCSLVFTAMFGSRRILISTAIFYISFIMVLHFVALNLIQPAVGFNLLSSTMNMFISLCIIVCLTYMNSTITKTALHQTQNELNKNIELNALLQANMEKRTEELKVLKGLLPICAACKKIRDDNGYWNQIESYIQKHSQAEFSHGICPECAKRLYPDFVKN